MRRKNRNPEDFDVVFATDEAIDTLRALRTLAKGPMSRAQRQVGRETKHARWLARRTLPSRTLGGC